MVKGLEFILRVVGRDVRILSRGVTVICWARLQASSSCCVGMDCQGNARKPEGQLRNCPSVHVWSGVLGPEKLGGP